MPKLLWRGDRYRLVDIGGGVPPVLEQSDGIDALGDPIWRPVKSGQPVPQPKPSRPKAKTVRKARPTNGLTLRASILAAMANEGRPVEVKDIMPKLTGFAKQSVYAEITRLSREGMIGHPASGIGWALTLRSEQPAAEEAAS